MLIAAINSQARLVFNAGREWLLARWIGRVQAPRQVPRNAIFVFVGVAGAIIVVWALGHLIGGHSGSMNPLSFFDDSGTMGTILVLVVYFIVVSVIYAVFLTRRDPGVTDRVGSIVADE